jgi:hypothetical protein
VSDALTTDASNLRMVETLEPSDLKNDQILHPSDLKESQNLNLSHLRKLQILSATLCKICAAGWQDLNIISIKALTTAKEPSQLRKLRLA